VEGKIREKACKDSEESRSHSGGGSINASHARKGLLSASGGGGSSNVLGDRVEKKFYSKRGEVEENKGQSAIGGGAEPLLSKGVGGS